MEVVGEFGTAKGVCSSFLDIRSLRACRLPSMARLAAFSADPLVDPICGGCWSLADLQRCRIFLRLRRDGPYAALVQGRTNPRQYLDLLRRSRAGCGGSDSFQRRILVVDDSGDISTRQTLIVADSAWIDCGSRNADSRHPALRR